MYEIVNRTEEVTDISRREKNEKRRKTWRAMGMKE